MKNILFIVLFFGTYSGISQQIEDVEYKFVLSKSDCSTDDAKYHLIIWYKCPFYRMEWNAFHSKWDSIKYYDWADTFSPVTRCDTTFHMTFTFASIKMMFSNRSSKKKFNPNTTFDIQVFKDSRLAWSKTGIKLFEEIRIGD